MRSLFFTSLVTGAALALSAGTAAIAGAEEPPKPPARPEDPAKASTLAEAALKRATQGERRVAIDLFEEAYAAAPRREYLKAIAELYDALALGADPRDVRLALVAYERYLREFPEAPDRAAMEARAARLREWKLKVRPEPMQRPPERVPVHLLAYEGTNSYEVAMGGSTCVTPCTLMVPPGVTKLETRGDGELNLQLVVPPLPSQIRLQHADTRGFTVGAIMLPVGILTGASLWALAFACGNDGACAVSNLVIWPTLGASSMIVGIVLLARGKTLPAADANRTELVVAGDKPRVWLTGGGIAPRPGGATGGLTFAF